MTAAQPPRLVLQGISKRFGSVQALRGADFVLRPGEVHALLGENGAGKTTLMAIADGLVRADAGTITVDGAVHDVSNPRVARGLGIGMVHQHFTSIPALTVAENVALWAGWKIRPRQLRQRVADLVHRIRLPLDPDARVSGLGVALKQRLEIVKALAADARILLLDEPTAVLAPSEAEELLRTLRSFAGEGGSAVLITHKLGEALAAADTVTVLRRGVVTLTAPITGQTQGTLARAMIGDSPGPAAMPPRGERGATLIHCEALEVARETGYGIALRDVAFDVRAGEIVGLAAVEGNGERELLRAVAGLLRPLRGILHVANPVSFVPEDRTTEGLIGAFSLAENVALAVGSDAPWVRGRLIDWHQARQRTAALIEEFGIRAPGPGLPAATLSGGNQQKLLLAAALERHPKVLVAENPTRGLDLSATLDVHSRLREAASAGCAALFYSSDLDEVLSLADRVLVASGGTVNEMAAGASRSEIGAAMLANKSA